MRALIFSKGLTAILDLTAIFLWNIKLEDIISLARNEIADEATMRRMTINVMVI